MSDIINFLPINDNIYTGGQPEADQFHLLKNINIKTVINLTHPTTDNAIPNEAELDTEGLLLGQDCNNRQSQP